MPLYGGAISGQIYYEKASQLCNFRKKILSKMKKSKLFKIAWKGEKIGRNDFWIFSPPPKKKKIGGRTKIFYQKWKNQSCSKWRENWSKWFLDFLALPPPKKIGGLYTFFLSNEKNQSCSELPEMARKLVEDNILIFKKYALFWLKLALI